MRWQNFYNSEFFKMKFGRDPKIWTIKDLHDLWLKLKDRNNKRYQDISDHLNHIRDTFHKNGNGEWIVYFMDGDKVRGYSIRELDYSGQLSYSIHDPKIGRELKINLITGDGFVLGERLHYLIGLTSKFEYIVFHHLSKMIYDEVFKNIHLTPFCGRHEFKKVIRISGKTYIFDATSDISKIEEIKEEDIIELQ